MRSPTIALLSFAALLAASLPAHAAPTQVGVSCVGGVCTAPVVAMGNTVAVVVVSVAPGENGTTGPTFCAAVSVPGAGAGADACLQPIGS